MSAPPLVRSNAPVDRIESDLRLQWTKTVCPKPWQALGPCSVSNGMDFEETVPTASDSQGWPARTTPSASRRSTSPAAREAIFDATQ